MIKFLILLICITISLCNSTLAQLRRIKHIALKPSEISLPLSETPSPAAIDQPSKKTVRYVFPLNKCRITSGFGGRKHPLTGKENFHNGIDLAANAQVVHCFMSGTVESIGYHKNLGKFICIDHGCVYSIYGHLSRIIVKNGQFLPAGFPMGITGNTGRTTGEHLHFSIRRNETYIDPCKFLYGLMQNLENTNH